MQRPDSEHRPLELSLRKRSAFAVVAVLLFLALLEGILAVAGVRPVIEDEDPFVGFAGNLPLFSERIDSSGKRVMATSTNKSSIFNSQQFPRDKSANAYRVFCVGGSTTYGRPYFDATSFAGWLRELLPEADRRRDWEVINAGGISYASYRVAALMEELADYEPDLFVVYTGHNEYLEERTYRQLRDIPEGLRSVMALLARTRIWTAASSLTRGSEGRATAVSDDRAILPQEVQAKLDHSAGPTLYNRDDELADEILEHYRVSLERMIRIARGAGAELILVTPASNLKDCTPFKAQSGAGLDAETKAEVARLAARPGSPQDRLDGLDAALALDERNADLHFARGRVLIELGLMEQAEAALIRARDEDVCPLRAISTLQTAVMEVAQEEDVPLVKFVELLEQVTLEREGHRIVGEELFLDHVHPTIEGHRLLALAILDEMVRLGVVQPAAHWNEEAIASVTERVEAGIDPAVHANALANLSLTLNWAGKNEESRKLAMNALESGYEDATMLMMVGRHAALKGDNEKALVYFRRAVAASPNSPVVHSQIGMLHSGRGDYEAAAAHIFLASLLWKDNDVYHKQLATVMTQRGRPRSALRSLQVAARLNPSDAELSSRIAQLESTLSGSDRQPQQASVDVSRHASGFPRTVAQSAPGPDGAPQLDGIWTEWYENGSLAAFADYRSGGLIGAPTRWSEQGERLP